MTRKSSAPRGVDPACRLYGGLIPARGWPIFLNGADTGLQAKNRDDAVSAVSRVLVRRGHFNATVEAVDRTYQEPLDAFHFIWPPTNGAVLTKAAKAPKPKRRRR